MLTYTSISACRSRTVISEKGYSTQSPVLLEKSMNPILHGLSLLKDSAVIAGLHVIAGVMHEGKQLAMTGVQRYSGAV